MRQGKVFYKNNLAGIITESDDGEYLFAYDYEYTKFPKSSCSFYNASIK